MILEAMTRSCPRECLLPQISWSP